ncbi:DUF2254 domain-containing protein [Algihabitans albus]|uniref:DUF2254 domain-containing protein n=1 Tax=Algihabitans albus TaxID=2164067 RepID=UPI000E5CB00B|nr:DUF2254 domain-containing protein [Algihabitans albus]
MKLGAKLIKISQDVRASYWFIPSVMLFAGTVLSFVTQTLDRTVDGGWFLELTGFARTRPDGSQAVLSTIAGSTIGVAGVVFSMTMVAVSFASGTYGPRLIGNFMRDRGNQLSLGIFISTFFYTLLILRSVRSSNENLGEGDYLEVFVPHVSLMTATGLALVCLCALIYFIHHIPETINIENIVSKLGRQLQKGIDDRAGGVSGIDAETSADESNWSDQTDHQAACVVTSDQTGYVQALDVKQLDELSRQHDLRVRVTVRAGTFVVAGTEVMVAWAPKPLADADLRTLQASIAIGQARTPFQNVEFIIDQLGEIIARALSPGVNDPFTAIACLNWLEAGTVHWLRHVPATERNRYGARLSISDLTFEEFLDAAYGRPFPYIESDPNVRAHAVASLQRVLDLAHEDTRRPLTEATKERFATAGS